LFDSPDHMMPFQHIVIHCGARTSDCEITLVDDQFHHTDPMSVGHPNATGWQNLLDDELAKLGGHRCCG
jgi:hypothetical protein